MFRSLGHLSVRRPRAVLAATGVFLVLAAVLGVGVFDRLSGGGFEDPSAESTRAEALLEERFDSGTPNFVILATASGGDGTAPAVDAPGAAAAGEQLTQRLADDPDVAEVVSYWSLGRVAPLRSTDGGSAIVVARLAGDEDDVMAASERLEEELGTQAGPLELGYSGRGPVFSAVSSNIEGDLSRAESIAVPITLLLLVIVFGGLVAAGLPLLVGAVSVLGTFLTLWLVSLFTDVSVFSINLVTALGLGLAIDYSLFIVSRFREELARHPRSHWQPDEHRAIRAAVVRTVETAGRTVAVSALTVAVSLSALLVFPLYFLRSFAYAGVGVTLVAAVTSVVALPALLAILGRRVDGLRLFRRPPAAPASGFWRRNAEAVMRRPVLVAVVGVVVLLLLGAPFLGVRFGVPDERVLPEGDPARTTTQHLQDDFSSEEANAFSVVVEGSDPAGPSDAQVVAYAEALSQLDGVQRVDAPTGRYVEGAQVAPVDPMLEGYRSGADVRISVVPDLVPISAEGEELVAAVRATDAPGAAVVGGRSAEFVDSTEAIAARLPWAIAIIVVATFVLLFLMFGSVLVPLKAIVLNMLSLSATFGAMVWIFQEGHLSGVLGFTATGLTDTTTPILMFCIAFGLSMDYEVFLLSRIKEEYDRTGDNTEAIAVGLERSGRIVTAAAALLTVTFLAFATSGISFIKLFGLGLALAVVMDATLIRATLVPAFMKLAGDANWWAPRWMRRIHDRFGFSEHVPEPEPTTDLVGIGALDGCDAEDEVGSREPVGVG
ncbi:MMPL family transporter [Dermatobacter hominis]|uniref:MMPL family transporter n=1 Tax=Dermatobacter hominis TaxID=2884263 RepID=UPI001D12779B|nr:MMPL family transporter [Dermatobacter hominis]UDY35423.1 MMPL family transporter [Dermatobacter hominis]